LTVGEQLAAGTLFSIAFGVEMLRRDAVLCKYRQWIGLFSCKI